MGPLIRALAIAVGIAAAGCGRSEIYLTSPSASGGGGFTAGSESSGATGISGGSATARGTSGSNAGATGSASGGTRGGSSGTGASSSGGATTGAVGCTIDGQFFAARASNPTDAAECCNPAIAQDAWLPLFTKAFSIALPVTTDALFGAIADLNQDGLADVGLISHFDPLNASPMIWIYLSGDGGFAGPFVYESPDGGEGSLNQLTFGDLNGDRRPDLIASTDSSLEVFLNLGGGQFGAPISVPTTYQTSGFTACRAGPIGLLDANLDGWQDVAVATAFCGLLLFLNDATGDGAPLASQTILAGSAFGPTYAELSTGDLNGDGYQDVAYVAYPQDGSNPTLGWVENSAGGFPSAGQALGSYNPFQLASFRNGQGDNLAALVGAGTSQMLLEDFQWGADGPNTPTSNPLDSDNGRFAVGDLNGDGFPDLLAGGGLIAGGDSAPIDVLLNQGDGQFGAPGALQVTASVGATWIGTGDLNGDGALDMIVFRSDAWEGWINSCGPGAAATLLDGGLTP